MVANEVGEPVSPHRLPDPLSGVIGDTHPETARNHGCREPVNADLHRPAVLDRRGGLRRAHRAVLRPRRRAPRGPRGPRGQGACASARECPVLLACRDWAREHREYGFWGGESEEERAAAGFRVDMPVGRVARYPKGDGNPVAPRTPQVA